MATLFDLKRSILDEMELHPSYSDDSYTQTFDRFHLAMMIDLVNSSWSRIFGSRLFNGSYMAHAQSSKAIDSRSEFVSAIMGLDDFLISLNIPISFPIDHGFAQLPLEQSASIAMLKEASNLMFKSSGDFELIDVLSNIHRVRNGMAHAGAVTKLKKGLEYFKVSLESVTSWGLVFDAMVNKLVLALVEFNTSLSSFSLPAAKND